MESISPENRLIAEVAISEGSLVRDTTPFSRLMGIPDSVGSGVAAVVPVPDVVSVFLSEGSKGGTPSVSEIKPGINSTGDAAVSSG